jgi:serine/threonine-protein kinase
MSNSAPGGPPADREFLFGILAVRMGFLRRDDLRAGLEERTLDTNRPLGDILVQNNSLTIDQRAIVEEMIADDLVTFGNVAPPSVTEVLPPPTPSPVDRDPVAVNPSATLFEVDSRAVTTEPAPPAPSEMRYRFVRTHARGGLGVVSVARDAELDRDVALKELDARCAGSETSRGRFVREARITGGLEHPGIVPVYGLGRHADGRPYYAMRFIRGETFQEAIRKLHTGEAGYTLRGLLTRLVAVCNAVAYAHNRGVIHRDLKPSNIMLGAFGETLVVDWGLAKVIGHEAAADDLVSAASSGMRPLSMDASVTMAGSALGTPAYMSPEQARGEVESLDTATDIYSLGAVLYSVLAGRAPVTGRDVSETLENVRKGHWPRARQVKSSVPAALDAVSQKAMSPTPTERYDSALDLAADIERWLADEPVSAYREPLWARVLRWARHHRVAVAASVPALLVALCLGGGVLIALQRDEARRRAGAETALKQVSELLAKARWTDARTALEQADARLSGGGPADLRERLDANRRDLELVARLDDLRMKRATNSAERGAFDNKGTERAYAATFQSAGLGGPGDDPESTSRVVATSAVHEALVAALDNWAFVASGETRTWALEVARRADPDPWRDRLRDPKAWANEEELAKLAKDAPAGAATPALAAAVGGQLRWSGSGESLMRAAQALRPDDFWLNLYLGYVLTDAGRPAEGEGFDRAALGVRPDSSMAHNNLAWALERQGKFEQAETYYRKAIELDAANSKPQANLAVLLARRGKLEEAESLYRSVLEKEPGNNWTRSHLGFVLERQGRLEDATAQFLRILELDARDAGAHFGLGVVLARQGKLEESASRYQKTVELDPSNVAAYLNLAQVLLRLEQFTKSADAARRALALLASGDARRSSAELLLQQVKLVERLPAVLRGEDRPADAAELLAFADLCYHRHRYADGARLAEEAFGRDPKTADDHRYFYRYNAACCAALAGCGRGENAPESAGGIRLKLRQLALQWLRAELAARSQQLSGSPAERTQASSLIRHWQVDPDLAGVRDAAALSELSAAERRDWEAFWANVNATLMKPARPN